MQYYKFYDIIKVDFKYLKDKELIDMKDSDTSALLEVIKEQNKTIESLRKTIEEMSLNSKLLREQIDP